VTDWLATCRAAVADVQGVLADLPTRVEREPVVGTGEGGDETTVVDAEVERVVLALLDDRLDDYTLISEEIGEVVKGSGTPWLVLDPVDGSLNAKRGVPHFCLSLAVADGPTMDDVTFGFVHDLGAGEEWVAERGRGARLGGEPLDTPGPKETVEILALEGTTTEAIADVVDGLRGVAHRVRVMGSLALSLCHLAAGRVDAVCCLKPARSIDIAAAQLLVRERGLAIELFEDPPFGDAPLDLGQRSRIVAAAGAEQCSAIASALRASTSSR